MRRALCHLTAGRRARPPAYRVRRPMDLLEYQGKQLFARHGIPVPDGRPARTRRRGRRRGRRDRLPVRRQGAGADRRARQGRRHQGRHRTRTRRGEHADAILGMDIRGLTVHEVWVERASEIAAEYYASIVFDRAPRSRWSCSRRAAAWTSRPSPRRTRARSRRCTSTRCSASRTSTGAGWPSRPASTPTSCARSARCCPALRRLRRARRRCSSRSTR